MSNCQTDDHGTVVPAAEVLPRAVCGAGERDVTRQCRLSEEEQSRRRAHVQKSLPGGERRTSGVFPQVRREVWVGFYVVSSTAVFYFRYYLFSIVFLFAYISC